MSVRVNLLPEDVQARGRASRARMGLVLAGVLLLAVLGGLWFMQEQQIDDARQRLAETEETNAQLQADITALAPFADLESRAGDALDLVAAALAEEVSMAAILQDLSAVMPPDTQIDNLNLTLTPEGATAPSPGGQRLVYGRLVVTGQVLGDVAPGVERLIIDIDRVAAFDNAYVTTTSVDENGVTSFSLEIELGPEVLTERYLGDDTGSDA